MSDYKVERNDWVPLAVTDAEVMTLSEAARYLGISPSAMTGLLNRRVFQRVMDTREPNPTRAHRVLRESSQASCQAQR